MARWQRLVPVAAGSTVGLTMAPMIGQDVCTGGGRFLAVLTMLAAIAILVLRYL